MIPIPTKLNDNPSTARSFHLGFDIWNMTDYIAWINKGVGMGCCHSQPFKQLRHPASAQKSPGYSRSVARQHLLKHPRIAWHCLPRRQFHDDVSLMGLLLQVQPFNLISLAGRWGRKSRKLWFWTFVSLFIFFAEQKVPKFLKSNGESCGSKKSQVKNPSLVVLVSDIFLSVKTHKQSNIRCQLRFGFSELCGLRFDGFSWLANTPSNDTTS